MSEFTRHTASASPPDVKTAFEKFLKEPWPLADSQMSERKRLWVAFDAGAQYVIDYLRIVFPPPEAQSDEDVSK